MIITVTPNPAWDVTYEVPALVPGQVHRVAEVRRRLGGKGVNVARVLASHGHDCVAVLPGPGGLAAEAGLDGTGPLTLDVVPGLPAIRQTLVVHDAGGVTTSLWEPGARPGPGTGAALAGRVRARLGAGAGIVISGSLPPGLDARLPARLAATALDAGVPAVIDTSGEALAHAAAVPGVVLAPNSSELAQLAGSCCAGVTAAVAAARALIPGGPRAVVVTLGEDGLVAVTDTSAWHGRLARPLAGNPTGAGDAAAAALITGLAGAAGWPGLVGDMVALSASAVLSPVAGEASPADFSRLRADVTIRKVA